MNIEKKSYSPPTIRKLNPGQAKKLIADHRNCSEEEAAEFLDSLQRQQRQDDQKQNEPLNDTKKQERKHSAF